MSGSKGADAVEIRPYQAGDASPAARLFFDAVRVGARGAYSDAERAAWAPEIADEAAFAGRLTEGLALMAAERGVLVGFMTLLPAPSRRASVGLIDLAYVRPDRHRRGVGARLLAAVETVAAAEGLTTLETRASLIAEPFFARCGFAVEARHALRRGGVILRNATMRKALGAAASADVHEPDGG